MGPKRETWNSLGARWRRQVVQEVADAISSRCTNSAETSEMLMLVVQRLPYFVAPTLDGSVVLQTVGRLKTNRPTHFWKQVDAALLTVPGLSRRELNLHGYPLRRSAKASLGRRRGRRPSGPDAVECVRQAIEPYLR